MKSDSSSSPVFTSSPRSSLLSSLFFILLYITLDISFVSCQQQYFRVKPQSNVEVIQGSNLTLNCAIGSQAGAAQWTKNGFALGFNRSIPGYPRYFMPGDGLDGVHNLKIIDARIDDEGIYECQVGPGVKGRSSTPIKASSKVTVLLRPQSINISGHSNGSYIEVREEQEINLECLVSGAKPAADIKWFRRGFQVSSNDIEVTSTETVTKTYTTESDSGSHDLTLTGSSIRLKASAEDNGVIFSCEASHPALSSPMRTSIVLSVLHPPGPPEIQGYTSGDAVQAGDIVTLVCKSKGGNPLAQLVWLKNNEPVDFTWYSVGGRESVNEYTFTVDASDNNAVYRCQSNPPQLQPNLTTVSVKMSVHYPASIKKITEQVLVDQGKNAYLECQVDANPITQDLISWRKRVRNSTTFDDTFDENIMFENIVGESMNSSSDSRVRITHENNRSFLMIYNVTREDSGLFECVTSNGIGGYDTATSRLLVKHKPVIDRSPSLFKSAVESGETGRLNCRAEGAPNVTFEWTHEGQVLGENKEQNKWLIEPTIQLDFLTYQSTLVINKVSKADYGSYTCLARNQLGRDSLSINFTRTSKPDTPLSLKVMNMTSESVTLKWVPGFDGGHPQSFRLRFKSTLDSDPFLYSDVFPSNTTSFTVYGLAANTEYTFNVMAYNSFGESDYTSDNVKAQTSKPEVSYSGTERVLSQVLSGRAFEFPKFVILAVGVVGSCLLIINVFLVVCFVKKRSRNKKRLEEESDQSSTSKNTASLEMCAQNGSNGGSNYSHGVTETSLSGSDEENKSDRASSSADFGNDMNHQQQHHTSHPGLISMTSHQTYLIDDNFYPPSLRFPSDPRLESRTSDRHVSVEQPDLTMDAFPPSTLMYASLQRQHHNFHHHHNRHHNHHHTLNHHHQNHHPHPPPSLVSHHHPQHHLQSKESLHTVSGSVQNTEQYLHLQHEEQYRQHHEEQIQEQSMNPSSSIPPLPPLRVTPHLNNNNNGMHVNNNSNNFSLPSISEEVFLTTNTLPVGHLV